MKLFEFEAKEIIKNYGFEIPQSVLIKKGDDIEKKIRESKMEPPFAVKAQVLVAGRGKSGGIKIVKTVEDAVKTAQTLFETSIKGIKPSYILIEKAIPHDKELYVGIVIDRSLRKPVVLASKFGGVDIEEIARNNPESIIRYPIDTFIGLRNYEARIIGKSIGVSGKALGSFEKFLTTLYKAFIEYDAELAESNPLAYLEDKVIPLDLRITIDDNSLYRHENYAAKEEERLGENTEYEIKAHELDLAFVELDGDIGVLGNGAGLTMTTMDLIYEYGGKPANFLDMGGGAEAEHVKTCVKFLLDYPKAKKIFINMFGGITRADEVAKGVVMALNESSVKKPIVIRLTGTNEEQGKEILKQAGIEAYNDPIEAVKSVVGK
ncbi:succinyl-CoA synthetase, beta subunit [Caldisphaera lagunensis DSM 15908]|uniref:Succinate--CoA ligase [ADP-forming] subunit beta n=1 Tax=Caldisphaera lagunensis (strain DSM 15908 / JCM 11604 / ANMR 0165 / IC-154) TaxID=1056495 RepID=L0A8S5_CALLD|nr:ADP-forming succinate--CoA ligase subunit beta [Caldisphaera lagunensis]AFZ70246.1 succinyl-CoA synthetase, beta subunit [Caldisphaera lagunensis DSM 15908]